MSGAHRTIRGTRGNDTLIAAADHQILLGRGGDDILISRFNDTILDGGHRNDILTAEATVRATAVTEPLTASHTLIGGDGDDLLTAKAVAELLGPVGGAAGSAANSLDGASATNTLDGGDGDDTLIARADAVLARLSASATNTLDGGAGDDILIAAANVRSGPFFPPQATNDLDGGAGNDTLTASVTSSENAANTLHGGAGDDILLATVTEGSAGRSVLFGGAGDDRLTVVGGIDNRLADGLGKDWMIGGDGKDNFVLTANDTALDMITAFSGAAGDQDKVDLTDFGAGPTVTFEGGILTVNDEEVAEVFGEFDPATDLILV